MGIKNYNSVTPARRNMTVSDYEEITKAKPEKSLIKRKKNTASRNNKGRITVRSRGGGNKKRLREIDFKRDKFNIPGKVEAIEYDPNRSAHIALVAYNDGEKRYILAPINLKIGAKVMSGDKAEVKVGCTKKLKDIPAGISIHNVELRPGAGGQMIRSAGQVGTVMAKEGKYATVKMPSGEVRFINKECMATIGQVGNLEKVNVIRGKAGKGRYLGKRPHVRGVAMNPIDHPMGGGEGAKSGGGPPVSPTGQYAKGKKTRKKNKNKNKFIIQRRKK